MQTWRNLKTWQKWVAGIVAAFVVLAIIGALIPDEDEDKKSADANADVTREATTTDGNATAEPEDTEEPEPTEKPEDTAEPAWSSGVPLTDASIRGALSDGDEMTRSVNIGDPRSIEIDGGWIIVTYKIEDALKETDMLSIGGQTAFSAHKALFENPLVQTVTVTALADWTDQFGATTEDVTTVSTLERATVDARIQWDGLEDRVIIDNKNMFCVSDAYRIHLGIYSRLDDTGCLIAALKV